MLHSGSQERPPQDAKGMTTDVYPRENCIAPDMCCKGYELVYEPGSPRTQEVEGCGVVVVRDGRGNAATSALLALYSLASSRDTLWRPLPSRVISSISLRGRELAARARSRQLAC